MRLKSHELELILSNFFTFQDCRVIVYFQFLLIWFLGYIMYKIIKYSYNSPRVVCHRDTIFVYNFDFLMYLLQ